MQAQTANLKNHDFKEEQAKRAEIKNDQWQLAPQLLL